MSRANADVVRPLYALWDAADVDPMVGLLDADVVASAPEGWPESGPTLGRADVLAQMRSVRANFEDQTMLIDRIETKGDRVVTGHRVLARGKRSGLDAEFANSGAFRLQAGKIIEARFFWDHDEALNAAGLAE
ncbi:MAG TPA: nuclear transport factor 2 family protein [Solirubrobacteraceae bacterium]|nr:nuclear transport factor 2 family protein [Solirubrobacteraceae bacterium]